MNGSSRKHEVQVVLKKHFADLCTALPIDDLLPRFVSENIITFDTKKAILANPRGTQSAKTEDFLENTIIRSLQIGYADSFYKLLKVMKCSSLSSSCGLLADRIIDDLPNDIRDEVFAAEVMTDSSSSDHEEGMSGKLVVL